MRFMGRNVAPGAPARGYFMAQARTLTTAGLRDRMPD